MAGGEPAATKRPEQHAHLPGYKNLTQSDYPSAKQYILSLRKGENESESAPLLAQYGVPPGASIYIAEAALVTEDRLAALRDPLCITRLPATDSECGRGMAEAVAHNDWEEVGGLAQTPPTQHRPGTFYKVAEGEVTWSSRQGCVSKEVKVLLPSIAHSDG